MTPGLPPGLPVGGAPGSPAAAAPAHGRIFDQGYRPYSGPIRRGSRALAIAWESFRPRMRWWVWLLTFMFTFWPYLAMCALSFAFLMFDLDLPGRGIRTTDAFPRGSGEPMIFADLTSAAPSLYWRVMQAGFANSGPMVVAAVACAGILASDRRTNALHLYFSRPVTRRDYLLGKALAVAAFSFLLTAIPTLVLYGEVAGLRPSWTYVSDTWWVPFAVILSSAVYSLWTASFVLLFSSLLQRPVLIGTVTILVHLFLSGLGAILAHSLREPVWRLMLPHYVTGAVTAPLYGLTLPDATPWHLCAAVAFGVPALSFVVVVRRLRAVEVVT